MKVLVLDDGVAANRNQALGIALLLEGEPTVFPVRFGGPSYTLPGRRGTTSIWPRLLSVLCWAGCWNVASSVYRRTVNTPPFPRETPDVVASAGSFLAPVNLLIARRTGAASVTSMLPEGLPLQLFDAVILPRHDARRLKFVPENAIVIDGVPTPIRPDRLASEAEKLASAAPPRGTLKVGLLIGGNDQHYLITRDWCETLFGVLARMPDTSLYVTTSRRTPPGVVEVLRRQNPPNLVYREFPDSGGASHYLGILGLCDALIVTEDSVNMVFEALDARRPLLVLGVRRRPERMPHSEETLRELVSRGCCQRLSASEMAQIPEALSRLGRARHDGETRRDISPALRDLLVRAKKRRA